MVDIKIILFFVGFAALVFGARFLINGSVSIGKKFGIPHIIIGLTIVAFGTSLPEFIISVMASIKNEPDLAISNVLGSNIANIMLILGVAAIINPISTKKLTVRFEIPFNLIITILLLAFLYIFRVDGNLGLNRIGGIIFLIILITFIPLSYKKNKSQHQNDITEDDNFNFFKSLVLIIIGLAFLYLGGQWIVDGTKEIAEIAGISKSTIGIKIVAVATSLPELVTTVYASIKRQSDIAIGNVIGSNIFNILLVLGTSATIKPLAGYEGMNTDWAMAMISILLLFIFIIFNKKRIIVRYEGWFFIILYFSFMIFREKLLF